MWISGHDPDFLVARAVMRGLNRKVYSMKYKVILDTLYFKEYTVLIRQGSRQRA